MNQGAQTNRDKATQRAETIVELKKHGYTYAEIGDKLGMTTANARQIMCRQNKRLSKGVEQITPVDDTAYNSEALRSTLEGQEEDVSPERDE